ncbi:MAG TPA: anibiotic ABC transporter [Verrucomicrobiae bacterium]|nr:anibiotic ABC transporter [Verrucomicrobiae bacterium]
MAAFTGLGKVIRLALRRDRLKLPLTILLLAGMFFALTASVVEVYGGSPAERAAYATTSAVSTVAIAFNGPVLGDSLGSVAFTETFTFFAIFVALATTLLVIRHTRQNEEHGRMELLGAAVIGRHVPLTAALVIAAGFAVLIGGAVALSFVLHGLPFSGSLLAGTAMTFISLSFAGIAAVTAQLTRTARAANGLAAATIGAAFLVRALGDIQGEAQPGGVSATSGWLSWLSPIGIARNARPFAENQWWVIGILVAICIAFLALGYWLASRRDLGTGLLPSKSGRATARGYLLSTFGLAFRLQRGIWLGWCVGISVLAVTLGAVAEEVGKFSENSEQTAQIIAALGGTASLTEAYLSFALLLFGVAAVAYSIQATLRVRSEEASGHLEMHLATQTHRSTIFISHAVLVAIGAFLLLIVAGATAGLTYGLVIGEPLQQTGGLLLATLNYFPAVLLFVGLTLLALGWFPAGAAAASWLLFAASYFILQFSQLLQFPTWVEQLSPLTHIPQLPAEQFAALPLLVLSGIGIAAGLAGIWRFTSRDMTT